MNIGAIILAAGSSSRMGQSKQLLDVGGQPLLQKTATTILDAGIQDIICVLGAGESEHLKMLESLPVKTIVNTNWKNGMGSSLKKGIAAFTSSFPNDDAAIVFVCDQPLLNKEHILKLTKKASTAGKAIIASSYENTVGVPVLFARSFFNTLATISDDAGAKKIFAAHADQLATVDFPDGAVDLDTPDDYSRFKNKNPRS